MENKTAPAAKANETATAPAAAAKPAAPVIPAQPTDKKYKYRGREFVDLRGASGTMAERKDGQKDPHKYVKVHAAAEAAGSPCKIGWRYATTVFKAGSSKLEKKEGTAHGIIQSLVKAAGPNGISGMELVPLVRARAKQNTRTNFGAGAVPPIGWAEGWIDSAVTQNIIAVIKGETLKLEDVPTQVDEQTAKAA